MTARTPEGRPFIQRLFRDPLSIVLVLVIVLALVVAGLVGGELYARSRADGVVARAVECVVQDDASVLRRHAAVPVQHVTGHYTQHLDQTAGNQIRDAKGMKVDIDIDDVRLEDTGNSRAPSGR